MKMPNPLNAPLRYRIVNWNQATQARSNNDPDLRIKVTDLINDERLTGHRIAIVHPNFGTLFSCVLNAHGTMITELSENVSLEPSTDQILAIMRKYGFDIIYKQISELPAKQLEFLRTLLTLGFDKIRILEVYTSIFGEREYKPYIIVFNVAQNPNWINIGHTASYKEFTDALANGSAVNISATSQANDWSWGWLDFVANIQDVLDENSN